MARRRGFQSRNARCCGLDAADAFADGEGLRDGWGECGEGDGVYGVVTAIEAGLVDDGVEACGFARVEGVVDAAEVAGGGEHAPGVDVDFGCGDAAAGGFFGQPAGEDASHVGGCESG